MSRVDARQPRPRGREPCDDVVRPDRARQAGVHVEHRLGDRVHGLERLEAAQHDAVRRRPQQAADDGARVLGDDEGGVEAVEARLDAEPSEQPEREVVLGLVGGEERAGAGEERVRVGDPGRSASSGCGEPVAAVDR